MRAVAAVLALLLLCSCADTASGVASGLQIAVQIANSIGERANGQHD